MHNQNPFLKKVFYASGFLYSLKTQQILLLQSGKDLKPLWSTMGGESKEGEESQTTFQRVINELINIHLAMKHIYPVYDYFHDGLNKFNYVFYAEVGRTLNFPPLKESALSWVTFDQTIKLSFTNHTKQDVIVGERVINLKQRISQGLQTLQ